MDVEVKTLDGKLYRYTNVYCIKMDETIVKIILYTKNGVENAFAFMKHQIVYVHTAPMNDETGEEK